MTKKFLSALIAIIMVIGLVPVTVFAEDAAVAEVNGTKYSTLIEAVEAAGEGATITLLKDCSIDAERKTITLNDGVTLDLNGKTLTIPFQKTLFEGENITIKNGILTTGIIADYVLYIVGGSFTLEDITTTNGINIKASTATLKGVNVVCNYRYYAVYAGGGAEVTINSGDYNGGTKKKDVYADDDSKIIIDMENTKFKYEDNLYKCGATCTVEDNIMTIAGKVTDAVASIGDVKYATLEAAVEAAEAGDTITLLKDIVTDETTFDMPEEGENGETAILDLKGYTIEFVDKNAHYITFDGGDFTIKNGVIENGGIKVIGGANVTIEDMKITAKQNAFEYAVWAYQGSDVDILSGTYFGGKDGYDVFAENKATITLYGGTYKFNIGERYMAKNADLAWVKNPDKTYSVVDATAFVAEVGGTQYMTLEAAIAAANADDTVTLLADIAASDTIRINKSITLELGGYTINSTANVAVYANGGDLTINGTTGGIYTTGTVAVGQDNGVCTIKGGFFRADGDTHDVANQKPVKHRYTIDNSDITADGMDGFFVIEGGSFYRFTPACMFINPDDGHDHDSIADGLTATLDEYGWFTVTKGELTHTIRCECKYPAPAHEYCFASLEDAEEFCVLTQCDFDQIYEIKVETPASITTYEQLVAAIDVAKEGDTITLGGDIDAIGKDEIVINKSITLNLGEYTITGNAGRDAELVYAVVRIYSDIVDTAINVTIKATSGGIVNRGEGYAIHAGKDIDGGNDAERTNLTINGGTYTTEGPDCIKQIMGLCTIEDGNYKSSFGRTVLNGERWYGAEFAINGGSFYGFNPACVSVWTGFDGKDWDNFYHQHDIIATGLAVEYNDGWYTVIDDGDAWKAGVKAKSMCFANVSEAINAIIAMNDVANFNELTLLADDTLTAEGATFALAESLTFVLDGHTLTLPAGYSLNAAGKLTQN